METIKNQKRNPAAWLFNPFQFWGGSKLFWIGVGVILLHIPIGYFFNVRFDGALDMHIIMDDFTLMRVIKDVAIAWGCMFLCLFGAAKVLKSPIRLIDIAGATALARVPMLIAVIPAKLFEPASSDLEYLMNLQGTELFSLLTGAFFILGFFIWFLVLLFNAYKLNSNLKGVHLWASFIIGVILAEAISLALISIS